MPAPSSPANSSFYIFYVSKTLSERKQHGQNGQTEANKSKSLLTQHWKSHSCFFPSVASARPFVPTCVNGKHKFRPDASKQTIFQLQEAVGHAIDGLPFPARVVGPSAIMTRPHSCSEAPGDNPCPHAAFIPSKRFSPCALLSYIDIAMRWPQGGPYCAFAPGQRCNNGVPNSALTQLLGWNLVK